jgi:hypothetical protein
LANGSITMIVKPPVSGSILRVVTMLVTLLMAYVFWQTSQFALQQQGQLKQAVTGKAIAGNTARSYQTLVEQFEKMSDLNHRREEVADAISLSGFQQSQWTTRDLKVESAAMPREQVEGYLAGVKNQAGYFFLPSSFVLKVPYVEDDIFTWTKGDSLALQLTLSGQYFIRR